MFPYVGLSCDERYHRVIFMNRAPGKYLAPEVKIDGLPIPILVGGCKGAHLEPK